MAWTKLAKSILFGAGRASPPGMMCLWLRLTMASAPRPRSVRRNTDGARRLSPTGSHRRMRASALAWPDLPRRRSQRRPRAGRPMERALSGRRIERPRTSRRMSCSRARDAGGLRCCGVCSTRRWRSSTAPRPEPTRSRSRRPMRRLPRPRGTLLRRLSVRTARAGFCRAHGHAHGARRSVAYGRLSAGRSVSVSSQTDRRPAGPRRCGSVVVLGSHSERRVASELLSALARSSSASTSSRRTRNARPTRTAGSVPWSIQLRIVCAVT